MDSWQQNAIGMPDLMDPSMAYNGDDWEDWLRWDPTVDVSSPDTSSKDSSGSSAQYAKSVGDSSTWMPEDQNMVAPFIVGEDTSMMDPSIFDTSMLNFASSEKTVDPFIFNGAQSLQPAASQMQADTSVDSKLGTDSAPQGRRTSGSTAGSSFVGSHLSPDSAVRPHSSASSLSPQPTAPPKKKVGRKRKSELVGPDGNIIGTGEPPVKKTSHNVIEKRYRNNLNDKILELRDSVPSLRAMAKPGASEDDSEDLEGLTPAHKLNKSTIMAKATEYIKHLEKRNKEMLDDMTALKERFALLEQNFMRSPSTMDPSQATHSPVLGRSRQSSINFGNFNNTQTLTSPMDAQMRYRNQMQTLPPSAFDAAQDEDSASRKAQIKGHGRGNFMGKLMVGSMAGLMVMEGFAEHNQESGSQSSKGLFAAPAHLMKRGLARPEQSVDLLLPALKLSLVLSALIYLALPLFRPKSKQKAKTIPQITLTAVPSLSSPVETRRKAWLTAIQSVWTPKPFLVEVVAVGVRMAELSFRRLVGFDKYAELLGMSKEDEAARIKAWDIAIDAQLAGGDAEVSYYHLLLTLMASGTLPDSPIRLMQKAVHFRIFFWEVANAGYGNLFMFKDFTAKVAKIYWNSARHQQRGLADGTASRLDENDRPIDQLPGHLAALIELECDEVLTDDVIQRAYNLAWNRPSAENAITNKTLDDVVADPAIRSPLDAVAAWFANTIIDESLALAVHAKADSDKVEYLMQLATDTAPPASSTLTRASVAKAVLVDDHREAHIAAALESLPQASATASHLGSRSPAIHLDVVNHGPVTTEIRTALTIAKLLSLSESSNPTSCQTHAAQVLKTVPVTAASFTLLTAVAATKLLEGFSSNSLVFASSKDGLEQLAFALRLWVGKQEEKTSRLERPEQSRIVDRCLSITKQAGGWQEADDGDSGYGSGLSRRTSDEIEAR